MTGKNTSPLYRLRKQLGLKQSEAAALLGTHQANYCRWELAMSNPGSPLASKGAEALAVLRREGVARFGTAWRDDWLKEPTQTDKKRNQTERGNGAGKPAP